MNPVRRTLILIVVLALPLAMVAAAVAKPADFCEKHPDHPSCSTTTTTTTPGQPTVPGLSLTLSRAQQNAHRRLHPHTSPETIPP